MGLTLRTVKGSALTYQELDDNFTYLSSSMTASSGVGFPYTGSAGITGSFSLVGSASIDGNIQILNSSGKSYISLSGSGGINEISLTTPSAGSDIVKARFLTIDGISEWAAFSINSTYGASGWELDKTSSFGGFFKLDSRDAYKSIAFYSIPSGSNPHIDESYILDLNLETKIVSLSTALVSPAITGSLQGTASYSETASYATTASYALNSTAAFPYTGSASISGSLSVEGSGSNIFTINGTSGELFNVNDGLSGSLFNVNNISGFPQFEVFSDGVSKLGNYSVRSLYHTALLTSSAANVSHSIYSFNTSSFNSVFFEYVATSASNAVVGNLRGAWVNGSIGYTDVSSSIGSPGTLSLSMIISQSQAQLILLAANSGWEFRTIIKAI